MEAVAADTPLRVVYISASKHETGERIDLSWCVKLATEGPQEGYVMVGGFGRKKDAELAMRVMPETGIDFTVDHEELSNQWHNYGGRKQVMKFVCERLAW